MKKNSSIIRKPEYSAYVFLMPSLIILLLFVILPIIMSFAMGFLKIDIFLKDISFAGLDNFGKAISDGRFWNALINTFVFALGVVPLQTGIALMLAIYVSKNTIFRKFCRTMLFIPAVCSMAAIGILWSILLDPNLGIYAYFLKTLGITGVTFLKDPNMAMPLVIVTTVWKNFGINMVILVAAIQAIPKMYYEAAQIDGAGTVKQHLKITLPQLLPALSFCIITNIIDSLKVFDQVYVMTQGGPLNRTETIVQYIYNVGFWIAPFNLGYASAIAEILFVLIALATLIIYRKSFKREMEVF